jgi:hypothetical protein
VNKTRKAKKQKKYQGIPKEIQEERTQQSGGISDI